MKKERKIEPTQTSSRWILKRSNGLIAFSSFLLILVLSFMRLPIVEMMDLKAYDLSLISRGSQKVHPNITIAVIDEKSLDAEGRWPWPRSYMANLINLLGEDGARVIGFDVGFFEPEKNPIVDFIGQLDQRLYHLKIKDSGIDQLILETRKAADTDQILADAIKHTPSDVVLGYFFHMSDPGLDPVPNEADIQKRLRALKTSRYTKVRFKNTGQETPSFFNALVPEVNLDLFMDATPYSGYFNTAADSDGVVRRLPLAIQCRQQRFPPLSLLCSWLYLDRPELHINMDEYGVRTLSLGNKEIPTDEFGQLLINYPGPAGSFPVYSITDILHKNIKPGTFKNKIVLVGVSASGLNDNRTTPFGPDHPGVEIHAAAISNILNNIFLTRSKWALLFDIAAVMAVILTLAIAIPRLSALAGFGFATLILGLQVLGTQLVFLKLNIWINMIYPMLAVIFTYVPLTVNGYFTETRERKKIKKIFSQYASADMIEEIVKEPGKLKLGGEEKNITVMFSDLANFTNISEKRTPSEVVDVMSHYFTEMTDYVFSHKGTLTEYVGDELMALYGAPLYQEDHAQNACKTALAMQAHLNEHRKHATRTGQPELHARIGINTGEMLVGNLGSDYRFSYGALGDNVNLASRLEGLNKIYGTKIIVGNQTYQQVKGLFRFRKLGDVKVKGRQTPERVFELIGNMDDKLSDMQTTALACYEAGYNAYLIQDWPEAIKQFEDGLKALPYDTSFEVMLHRCSMYSKRPPIEDWDGVFLERRK